jgi:hypothetical protein
MVRCSVVSCCDVVVYRNECVFAEWGAKTWIQTAVDCSFAVDCTRTAPNWAAYPGDHAVDCNELRRAFKPRLFAIDNFTFEEHACEFSYRHTLPVTLNKAAAGTREPLCRRPKIQSLPTHLPMRHLMRTFLQGPF